MKRTYHPLALNKSKPVHDKARRQSWADEHECCACCHWNYYSGYGNWLTTHHLANGKYGRSDEECNLLRLCERCHRLAEMENVRQSNGVLYPKLTLGIVLTLKLESDSEHYDPARLCELMHRASLPDLEPVPEVFLRERQRR